MKLKVDFDPTPRKALIIALLIFTLSFAGSLNVMLAMGEMPTQVQFFASLSSSLIAMVTYLLGFLGYSKEEEAKE